MHDEKNDRDHLVRLFKSERASHADGSGQRYPLLFAGAARCRIASAAGARTELSAEGQNPSVRRSSHFLPIYSSNKKPAIEFWNIYGVLFCASEISRNLLLVLGIQRSVAHSFGARMSLAVGRPGMSAGSGDVRTG
jgi:hypothetical protein